MHSSAVLILLVIFFFVKLQLELSECRERERERPVGTGTDGTPAGGVWLRLNVCFFFPWKTKNKRLALRARTPHCQIRTVTILRDKVVCQYSSPSY